MLLRYFPRVLCVAIVTLLIALPLARPGLSQETPAAQQTAFDQAKTTLEAARNTLAELAVAVDKAAGDDTRLSELKLKVEEVGKEILNFSVALQPRFGQITKRLTELGDPPAADSPPENALVAADRARLLSEKAQINALNSEAEIEATQAGDLANHITDLRRDMFTKTLFGRTMITMEMATEASSAVVSESQEFVRTVKSWWNFTWSFKRHQLMAALFASLISALALISGANRIFDPLIRRDRSDENPAYISRLSIAFWSTVLPTFSAAVFAVLILMFLTGFNVLREDIATFLSAFLTVLLGVYFVWRLTRAVVAPGKPQWRLLNISDSGARMLVFFALAMTIVNGMDYLLEEITTAIDSPVVLTIAKSFVASVLIGLLLVALSFIKPMNGVLDAPRPNGGSWPRPIRFALLIGGIGLIITAVLGYIGLARFVSTQIVITGAILVTMYIGYLSGKAVANRQAFGSTVAGGRLAKRFALSDVQLDQVGLAAGLAIGLLVLILGLPLILLQWGFQLQDIRGMAIRLFTEIKVGNITISLFGLLGGVLVFILGLVLTRWFQRWLDGNVMARSQVDSGVRNSVNTALGYVGVAIAGLLGVSAAGIDLSSLALVAGALSLGIGFGLQNIVSNFVSGLILLAERPFKVGDWVVTGTTEGFVKRISVRATEIETFQHQSIIVPNAELINASLGNWTHRNKLGRSEIKVSVSYDSDPRRVMDILLELANEHPLVLKTPEVTVAFLQFADFSLDFELRVYLADLLTGTAVRNDLRLAIIERFRLEGIEIPFPQRNLNIRFDSDKGNLEGALAEEGMPPEMSARIKAASEKRRLDMQSRMREDVNGDDDSGEDR